MPVRGICGLAKKNGVPEGASHRIRTRRSGTANTITTTNGAHASRGPRGRCGIGEPMGGVEGEFALSTAEIIARAVGVPPVHWLEAVAGAGLSAARWRFERLPPIGGPLPDSLLSYRAAGSASATKCVDGRAIRKRPKVGSVSYAPSNGRATWSVDGAFEAVHVYLHPTAIHRVAEQQLELDRAPEIDDFFAVEDPWLAGYFQMLASELEVRNPLDRRTDPLLLDQSEHLLVRHLLRWYRRDRSEPRPDAARRLANPLRPAVMRRVEEFVQADLA